MQDAHTVSDSGSYNFADFILRILWRILGRLIPKDLNAVALVAFPDFDDTTRAFVRALAGTSTRLFVLLAGTGAPRPSWCVGSNVHVVAKLSPAGVWFYHRAKVVVFTHGAFGGLPINRRQTILNVWHGMPIKRIGLLDAATGKSVPKAHYAIADDERFRAIMAAVFGLPQERVLIAEHPRMDVARMPGEAAISLGLPRHCRFALWLPTFRTPSVGDPRLDGDGAADVSQGGVDLDTIDRIFAQHGMLCLIKPHPMARPPVDTFGRYSAIRLVTDSGLLSAGTSTYEMLGASSLLISDISSVYFDYRRLGKPTILFCPDIREYERTRGFVAPVSELVSDPIATSLDELGSALSRLLEDPAAFPSRTDHSHSESATLSLLTRVGLPIGNTMTRRALLEARRHHGSHSTR